MHSFVKYLIVASSGQIRAHELGDMLNGLVAFGELADLKHMDHARPDLKLHFNSIRSSLGRNADTIVTKHLMLTDLDQQRWDAVVRSKYWRGEWIAGIGLPKIKLCKYGHAQRTADGIFF